MAEKNLIVHSDEVKKWNNLRDLRSKEEHLRIADEIRREEGTIEITSEQDPAIAVEFFEPGDTVTLYGQSTGKYGCVTRAAKVLKDKGINVKFSKKPYSTLPWPNEEIS